MTDFLNLLSDEDKRSLVLVTLYAAEKEGRGGVSTHELEVVLDWAWGARLDAQMVNLAIAGELLVYVTDEGMQFALSPKGSRSAQESIAPLFAMMYPPTCRVCGCTEDLACPGGCAWISMDPPTCSSCAPDTTPEDLTRLAGDGLISTKPAPIVDAPFGKGRRSSG